MVGLFSCHANHLQKMHRHLVDEERDALAKPESRSRKHRSQPRISDEVAREIVDGYLSGKTVYELAEEHGCHRVTVSEVLRRNRVHLRRTTPTIEQVAEMVRLYRSGLSLVKVGESVGVHATTVLAQLRKVGENTRSPHGA